MVFDNVLLTKLPVREAARGYLISLRAFRYSPRYIESVEMTLRPLADYAEAQGWPATSSLAASHIEVYLVYLQERPRWFGSMWPAVRLKRIKPGKRKASCETP